MPAIDAIPTNSAADGGSASASPVPWPSTPRSLSVMSPSPRWMSRFKPKLSISWSTFRMNFSYRISSSPMIWRWWNISVIESPSCTWERLWKWPLTGIHTPAPNIPTLRPCFQPSPSPTLRLKVRELFWEVMYPAPSIHHPAAAFIPAAPTAWISARRKNRS